jgi:hypothetical protein
LVEAGLLLQKISTGWLGGFFFQGEMHAFVPAVGLSCQLHVMQTV